MAWRWSCACRRVAGGTTGGAQEILSVMRGGERQLIAGCSFEYLSCFPGLLSNGTGLCFRQRGDKTAVRLDGEGPGAWQRVVRGCNSRRGVSNRAKCTCLLDDGVGKGGKRRKQMKHTYRHCPDSFTLVWGQSSSSDKPRRRESRTLSSCVS